MSEETQPETGSIGWIDLTVENARGVRDFYARVAGWQPSPVAMGEYEDFNMCAPASQRPVAGICHPRGSNAGLPPVWLIYITVGDLDGSVESCLAGGGRILRQPTVIGDAGRYCVIEDPAGAAVALFEYRRQKEAAETQSP